jgi:L-threonylcarbamoyladenylate synthase
VTAPHVVGRRATDQASAALAEGAVIAAPGDGGYLLATRHGPDAFERLARLGPGTAAPATALMVVGRRAQAEALAEVWSKEAALLTDRMWPGPLTVIVPARPGLWVDSLVQITMPAARPLRALCRDTEPLVVRALRRPDGAAIVDPEEIGVRFTADDVALVLDGGLCRGLGPTVVDCTVSPPTVWQVGALPESFVEGSLMMANRRRLFSRRKRS